MKACRVTLILCVWVMFICAGSAPAAFMVESHPSGRAFGNFSYPSGKAVVYSATYPRPSYAFGRLASTAAFGGDGADDIYVYSYTPGVNEDNLTVPPGQDLGNGNVGTGLSPCRTGYYNVYITWPASTNVASKCSIAVTSDGEPVVLENINMNTGQSGTPGATDAWLKVASHVRLVYGQTYTVTHKANDGSGYVSMRSHGVLWELQELEDFPASADKADLSVAEGGGTVSYAITFTEPFPADLILNISPSDPNQVTINGAKGPYMTVIPASQWDQVQTITVAATDDTNVEGDHAVRLYPTTALADPNAAPLSVYNNGIFCYTTVHISDNEVPGVQITGHNGAVTVDEQGSTTDYYEMKLLYPPTANVVIAITADGQTLVSNSETGTPAATAQLTFTPANWYSSQKVYVTAVDDDIRFENNHTSIIHHSISTTAAEYLGVVVADVVVDVTDNECGVWGYSPYDFNEDCFVDLNDFAVFAANWLDCSQPYVAGCATF